MNDEQYLENEILNKDFINDFNLDECKKVANMLIKKYKRLKNSCPEEVDLRITQTYEPIYSCQLPRTNTTMNKVEKHIDDVNDYEFMNEKMKNIMYKMNSEERACFVELLLHGKTENAVAKIIGRSRTGLIPFYNSCIIRLVLAFHMEVYKNQVTDIDQSKEIELLYY